MEFRYTVDPLSDEPIMLVNKHIGNDAEDGIGIEGAQFMSELLALTLRKPKRIVVWINSPGGGVVEGTSMYSAVLLSDTPVDTVCVGMAASIAGVLFQAGRTREMMDYSFLMYHNPHGSDDKKLLNIMKGSINKMTARSGKSEEEITAMMNKTSYINASDALEYGMCDKVTASTAHNKKRLSHFSAPDNSFWKEANNVVNSIFNIEDIKNMKQVANKLGLQPEASEGSILEAVSGLQNKLTEVENKNKNDMSEWENKFKKAEADLKEAKDALDKFKLEKDAADKLAAEASDKALTKNATDMVQNYVKIGKIKNEEASILFWTELAKANMDIVKAQIEALPVNKTAVDIVNKVEGVTGVPKYTFAGQMGTIANKLEQAK